MAKTVKPIIETDQALVDIQEWLEKHPRRSEEEIKSLTLAEKIVELFLVETYLDDDDNSQESYDLDLLFGFAFFLSKDKEFGFTRTFLTDKSDAYIKKRKQIRQEFESIITHVNEVLKHLDKKLRTYRIQYNDLIVFIYDVKENRWKARIKHGNLENLLLYGKTIFQLCQNTKFITTNEVIYTNDIAGRPVETCQEIEVILS